MSSFVPAVVAIFAVYSGSLLLHVVIPATIVEGYCCDAYGNPLVYRLNGLSMLLAAISIFLLAPTSMKTLFYESYVSVSCVACALGVVVSLVFYLRGGEEKYKRCLTKDQVKEGSLPPLIRPEEKPSALRQFFLGREWNPRVVGVDVKMWLYAVGAIQLEMNVLSFLAYQLALYGVTSRAMNLYGGIFTWFLAEYMFFENVHLYTYDLFAEKIGFKLVWGCLFFYPFFYPAAGYWLCDIDPAKSDISLQTALSIMLVFFLGWSLTRGANMQKYSFRRNPGSKTFLFGLIAQTTVPNSRILCSGFWGLSRHLNYLGEIVQALALAVPLVLLSQSTVVTAIALTYPLYYIALFIPRQISDDNLCRAKYGNLWAQYEAKVPWRIVPFIY